MKSVPQSHPAQSRLRSILVFGVIALIVGLIVVGADWLFSRRLPNSRLEVAAYAGIALIVGFSFNAARQRIGKIIDFVFFRQWHQAREQAELIADALRRATSKFELYEPLTAAVASAFSLASVALFERVEGGGFVRVAAFGWPPGTIWHILADDPPAVHAGATRQAVDLDTFQWSEHYLPAGVARPTVMLPIIASQRVPAMLLLGAHEDGTGLDPDEIRTIRRLCADAAMLYGRMPVDESEQTAFLDRQVEPLDA